MKILGIGVDIVENKRIQKSIKNPLFTKRIYTPKELKQSKAAHNKVSYFSKRFAGKEAFWKAISPNKDNTLHFNEIEILYNENVKPYVHLIGRTKNRVSDLEKKLNCKFNFHISISDEKPHALAFVIIFLAHLN